MSNPIRIEDSSIDTTIHGTLPERTYQQLRNMIVRGRITPGARVVEEEVAFRFGVSRTPVREALAQLIQEGYLIPVPGKRRTEVHVAPLSVDSVRELWAMIGAIEGCAIRQIANITDARRAKLVSDLEDLNRELRRAAEVRPRNPDLLFELQAAFHQRFVNETAGHHLLGIYAILRPQAQRYEWVYGTRLDADYEPSTSEHLKIIAAIKSADADRSREAIESHWDRAATRTVKIIEHINAQPGPKRRNRTAAVPRRKPAEIPAT